MVKILCLGIEVADQLEKHFVRSKVKCGFRGQMDLLFLFGRRCFVSHSRTGMS